MTEAEIQRQIVSGLKTLGFWVARIQSGRVKVRGGWMQLAPDGTADLLAIKGNLTLWVEAKKAKGIQSEDQRSFAEIAKRAGHRYLVARSWDDVKEVL